ncbi:MAG: hypothetical protein PHF86_04950 [Candidatus Nanoarchaeia archaeon]|nr:hypothetical protein [Candidatus Nanoarchaeia archaeon]
MGYKPQGPDIFTLKQGYVECVSGSGHTYKVTHDSCNCKGFGFRKLCRHYRQAEKKGYLNNLEAQIAATYNRTEFSGAMKKSRMDAIRAWLDKKNIRYKPQDVIDIEKIMTATTTPQEVMAFFF